MSVIAFPNLAPQGPEASMSWELRSLTAINRSPLNAVATTLERPGAHWAVRMPYQNLAADRRARLQAFVSSARGHAQRFYVPVYGWTRRGSFPATELFANTAFDGTSGWSVAGNGSLYASDGIMHVIASQGGGQPQLFQHVALTQYAPHVIRAIVMDGRGTASLSLAQQIGAGVVASSSSTGRGYLTTAVVDSNSSQQPQYPAYISSSEGYGAGDFFKVAFTSLSRCALVDNAPNLLLRSDEIDNASWSRVGLDSVTADATLAPDGTASADLLVEDGANSGHYVRQDVAVSNAAADYALCVAVKTDVRSFCWLQIDELTGSSGVTQYFNLGTSAVGSSGATGANWANRRAFAVNLGNNWTLCCLVGRKTNAATSLRCYVGAADADGNGSYTGGGVGGIVVWGARLAISSVPTRYRNTVGTASAGAGQTGGALYLKGLPASTSGLLLQGDPAEIITGSTSQLVRTRAPLNSDAAGLGYFEFEPPLRISPSDNAAVIIHNPMCRMLMENNVNGWTDRLGGFADLEFAAVEDVSP